MGQEEAKVRIGDFEVRPGHSGDLHRWALHFDEQNRQVAETRMLEAQQAVKSFAIELNSGQSLGPEVDSRLNDLLGQLSHAAINEYVQKTGPHMANFYPGEAMNA